MISKFISVVTMVMNVWWGNNIILLNVYFKDECLNFRTFVSTMTAGLDRFYTNIITVFQVFCN